LSIVAGLALFAAPRARATGPFTDNFTALLAELQSRSAALSGSTDRTEKSQWKACNKAILAINKNSISLGTDLKTALNVTKILAKAFPSEFPLPTTMTQASITFSNNLEVLVVQVFSNFTGDVTASLATLVGAVNALPDGSGKTQALALITASQQQITDAIAAQDFGSLTKDLGVALKGVASIGKILSKGSGGGGGGNNDTISMNIDGVAWTGDNGTSGGEFTQTNNSFGFGGSKSSNPNSTIAIVITSGVTGPGTYTTGVYGTYLVYSPVPANFSTTSCTVIIDTLDTVHHKASGTYSFSATDGITTITVTQGAFNIVDLTVN
jgi:hypothetical protein